MNSVSASHRVFVLDRNGTPLHSTHPAKARRWIKEGKAKPFYHKGFFAIRLNKFIDKEVGSATFGCDPGSKFNGYTLIDSNNKVVININSNATTWVKGKLEARRNYRRARRSRNTPYRKCRPNRARRAGFLPPSTKARWDNHLRLLDILRKVSPISEVVIEDIAARTRKGQRKWNINFSPIEAGKEYFRNEVLGRYLVFSKFKGYETSKHRKHRGFRKLSDKSSKKWEAHCVDSHSLVEMAVGHVVRPRRRVMVLEWLRWNRRELHQGYRHGGVRKQYGSTRSMGMNRGVLVRHDKWGLCYVGGSSKGRVSLHCVKSSKRLCRNAKIGDLTMKTNIKYRLQTAG